MGLMLNGKKKKHISGISCASLLKKLKISREECIVKVNGKPAADERKIGAKDSVEIITIVFGG
ncbi:Uncharacterised protein [Candidatus Anstonella stagnisolia]|nr:Uncharacterised protein [Candidatus Anstonella stagnisolia]